MWNDEVKLRYSQGWDEIFVEVRCRTCEENGFFQLFEGGFEDRKRINDQPFG